MPNDSSVCQSALRRPDDDHRHECQREHGHGGVHRRHWCRHCDLWWNDFGHWGRIDLAVDGVVFDSELFNDNWQPS